jgi:hypothetical protein
MFRPAKSILSASDMAHVGEALCDFNAQDGTLDPFRLTTALDLVRVRLSELTTHQCRKRKDDPIWQVASILLRLVPDFVAGSTAGEIEALVTAADSLRAELGRIGLAVLKRERLS